MNPIRILAAAALVLCIGTEAHAMPLPQIQAGDGGVILARAGCGFGAHRGSFGGCRLNRGPRGTIRQAITGAPRGCPPGRYRVRGTCRFR